MTTQKDKARASDKLRGIITHEESQEVTKAFRELGHEFWSNDLKPCSGGHPEFHYQGDFKDAFWELSGNTGGAFFNFFGAHPDCTYLTNAGIRWLSSRKQRDGYFYSKEWSDFNGYDTYINPIRWAKMEAACDHFLTVYNFLRLVGKGYIENPRMHPYAQKIIGIPSTQFVHPYYFGTPQMKETHYWLVGLEPLKPTNMLKPPKDKKERLKWQDCWMAAPGPNRAELRSKTYPSIAKAKAEQWSKI